MNVKALEKKIRNSRLAYYNGEPIMSDREYDELIDELRDTAPDSRVLREIGAPPMGTTGKHTIPMGSLREAKTMEEMEDWMQGVKNGFRVMAKVDGLSVALNYEDGRLLQALTRGDGRKGDVVTPNVLQMQNVREEIPTFTGTLRGEAFLPVKTFREKYAEDYANPRNTAAGIVRRRSGDGAEDVEIRYFYVRKSDHRFLRRSDMLEYIRGLRIKPVQSFKIKTFRQFQSRWKAIVAHRYEHFYEMDGVVVYVDDMSEREEGDPFLPNDALVYKFDPDVVKTKVTEIEHIAGRSGRVNPRVHVAPVKVGGVTVTHATGNNYPWLKARNVGVGAVVEISRRGDTIPAVDRVLKEGRLLSTPTTCPICKMRLKKDGAYLKCDNLACEAKDSGKVAKWLELIEVKGVGKKMLVKLTKLGIRRPHQLYVTREFWESNFGKNGLKILQQLQDKTIVKPEFVLAAHVSNVGRRRFRAILDAGFTVEEILRSRQHTLMDVDGVGEEIAKTIVHGMEEEAENIHLLLDHVELETQTSKKGRLTGVAFKFTGKMSRKRTELEEMAENRGARIGWKKGFKNILVIADPNSQSTKAKAARKAGHEIISEEEFLRRVSE